MNKTTFSIVVPSFNQAQFITRTLESILKQKGDFSIECIVIDGGSKDGTVKILKEFELVLKNKKRNDFNKQIKYIWVSETDKGQSDAINKGLKMASGDIMAYLNSDDIYYPGTFKTVKALFDKNKDRLWLTGFCQIIDAEDNLMRSGIKIIKDFFVANFTFTTMKIMNYISQPATFWRKEILNKAGLINEDLHYAMDYDMWLRFLNYSKPILAETELAGFRIHGASKSESSYTKQFDEDYNIVCNYVSNPIIRFLHKIANNIIVLAYRKIK